MKEIASSHGNQEGQHWYSAESDGTNAQIIEVNGAPGCSTCGYNYGSVDHSTSRVVWSGSHEELMGLAKRRGCLTFKGRMINPDDYDYLYLSQLYGKLIKEASNGTV